MWSIVIYNWGFILNMLIPIFAMVYLKSTNKEYSVKEFIIQSIATIIYLTGTYYILFSTTTDIRDHEFWNGEVSEFVKEERYEENYDCSTTKCKGSGENRTCRKVKKTCKRYIPEKRYIITTNDEKISFSKSKWIDINNVFHAKETSKYRSRQTSSSRLRGEGDIWRAYPKSNDNLATSVSHSYLNYIVAANKNVLNQKSLKSDIDISIKEGSLREYPITHEHRFGMTQLNRIIDTTGLINIDKYRELLDQVSIRVGKLKQANPILYFTNQPRSFKYLLESYWKGAKKNDVILIIGINSENKIVWTDSISWTKNTDFTVETTIGFEDFNINLFSGDKLIQTEDIKKNKSMNLDMKLLAKGITENPSNLNISNLKKLKPVSDNSESIEKQSIISIVKNNQIIERFEMLIIKEYERKSMKEFEYLKENISIEWYWQLFVFILNGVISFFISRYMLMNRL